MTRKLVTLFLALAMVLAMVPATADTADLAPVNIDWYIGVAEDPDTAVVNDAVNDLQPPMQGGKRLKIYYATQGGVRPPTFVLFVNEEKLMQFSYQRYLENYFRKSFDFTGTPIRFILREKKKEV